jgi:hypothetical protein
VCAVFDMLFSKLTGLCVCACVSVSVSVSVSFCVVRQVTSVLYLLFIPALFTGTFQAMSDSRIPFAEFYSVLVAGYFVSQSYGQVLSVLVSPASKQLVGASTVLILCFLSGQNPTLKDLGSFRVVADILSFTRYQCEMLVFFQTRAFTPVFQVVGQAMNEEFGYTATFDRYKECVMYLMLQVQPLLLLLLPAVSRLPRVCIASFC